MDETVLFVVAVELVIVVGTEIGTPIVCQGRELHSRRLEQGGEKCLSIRGCIFCCLRDDGICIYL